MIGDDARVAPHSLEAERSVLGSILLHDVVFPLVAALILAADFYRDAHRRIFSAMLTLDARAVPIDLVTLEDELRRSGDLDEVGGPAYITRLVDGMPRSANVEYYAGIVKEKSRLRQLIVAATRTLAEAYAADQPAAAVVDAAQAALAQIADDHAPGHGLVGMNIVMAEVMEDLEQIVQNPRSVTGLSMGLTELDEMTRGLQKGDLVVVGARPAMGKTSLAINVTEHMCVATSARAAVFSVEMSRRTLGLRLLASRARVPYARLATGAVTDADWQRVSVAHGQWLESGLYIDDASTLTVFDVRARTRRLKAAGGLDVIVVDYLQLLHSPQRAENRNLEVGAISRALKVIAKDLDVPVVLLSQLGRAPELRSNHRPQLADLRDSGAIEQDADVVLFLYRDEKYEATPENQGIAEIIIAKQRNGPTGAVRVAFREDVMRFENLARETGA